MYFDIVHEERFFFSPTSFSVINILVLTLDVLDCFFSDSKEKGIGKGNGQDLVSPAMDIVLIIAIRRLTIISSEIASAIYHLERGRCKDTR